MDDRVDGFLFKNGIDKNTVPDVSLIEARFGMNRFDMACFQIIRNDDILSLVNKFIHCVGTDISGSS